MRNFLQLAKKQVFALAVLLACLGGNGCYKPCQEGWEYVHDCRDGKDVLICMPDGYKPLIGPCSQNPTAPPDPTETGNNGASASAAMAGQMASEYGVSEKTTLKVVRAVDTIDRLCNQGKCPSPDDRDFPRFSDDENAEIVRAQERAAAESVNTETVFDTAP